MSKPLADQIVPDGDGGFKADDDGVGIDREPLSFWDPSAFSADKIASLRTWAEKYLTVDNFIPDPKLCITPREGLKYYPTWAETKQAEDRLHRGKTITPVTMDLETRGMTLDADTLLEAKQALHDARYGTVRVGDAFGRNSEYGTPNRDKRKPAMKAFNLLMNALEHYTDGDGDKIIFVVKNDDDFTTYYSYLSNALYFCSCTRGDLTRTFYSIEDGVEEFVLAKSEYEFSPGSFDGVYDVSELT